VVQLRFHGRGGQGVVTTAELLSVAAFLDGRHAQAFPFFGSERTGAPVASFCRIDDRPIRTHDPVSVPDVLVIQDPTLLHQVPVFAGLRDGGLALVNSAPEPTELGLEDLIGRVRLVCVPATEVARRHLGRPMPGAPLLGALAAITGVASIDSVADAIAQRFTGRAATGNVAAARAAHAAASPTGAVTC
jgi:pyruvate ferredoxin oxidoreductase gamma subunit